MSTGPWWWRIAGLGVAVLAAVGLRQVSALELQPANAATALARLSWSARPERVERCRRVSDEELARLPAHMRLRFECEGAFARYLLSVTLDDRTVRRDTIRGSGLRHDRPMHVFEEVAVRPGRVHLVVELVRVDSATTGVDDPTSAESGPASDTLLGARAVRELDERRRRAREAIEPHLVLDTTVLLAQGQVVLVTYDGDARRLTAVRAGDPERVSRPSPDR